MAWTALKNAIVKTSVSREVALRLLRIYADAQIWRTGPRIIVISFPKAGTHLMTSELSKLPGIANAFFHLQVRKFNKLSPQQKRIQKIKLDIDKLERQLSRLCRGQFVTSHMGYNNELNELLQKLEYKIIFVIRDPRDVLVSEFNYIMNLPRHFLNEMLRNKKKTDDERFELLICGTYEPPHLNSLKTRWNNYMGWYSAPGVLTVRFEDLVGARGGGDDAVKRATMERVAAHLGLEGAKVIDDERLYRPTWTPTLRTGQSGRWREVLHPRHVALLDSEIGDVITRLGYAP